jgi:phosphoribosylamine--glycine ligase
MKIMIIGAGGREHALGWKLAGEDPETELYFLPGNGGTAALGTNLDVAASDLERISAEVGRIGPDLVVIGPEDPLALGLADRLSEAGARVFGPGPEAARIESSKAFAKELMVRNSVPTASFKVFTEPGEAHSYIDRARKRLVVKADGLAKGKGALVTASRQEAHHAVESMMVERRFGEAGETVVIEERLSGEEASVMAVTDGERYVVLPPSQDHKRALDGDRGPNTGGMGAYTPAPVMGSGELAEVEETVIKRLLKGLSRQGVTYRGVLYAGLMINDDGIFVIEFNARFGDPEIQCVLPAVDVELGCLMAQAADGHISDRRRIEPSRWGVCVVMASGGYPGSYEKGKEINGLEQAEAQEGVVVFHAGTSRTGDGRLITSGGRVLGVTGTGRSLRSARRKAYNAARTLSFDASFMRTDIGKRGLQRLERTEVV